MSKDPTNGCTRTFASGEFRTSQALMWELISSYIESPEKNAEAMIQGVLLNNYLTMKPSEAK